MAPTLRGVAYGLSIFVAAMTGLALETALLIVLFPFPRWISRNLVGWLTTMWFELASFLLVSLLGLRLYVHGDPLPPHHARESALVISNHPTRIDWMLLWPFFSECGVLSDLKIVLKVHCNRTTHTRAPTQVTSSWSCLSSSCSFVSAR